MAKVPRYTTPDGRYDHAAYQAAYRAAHQDRRSLWRLHNGFNEVRKYPSILEEARAAAEEFLRETAPEVTG